jgi:hypothetical protein
MTKPILYDFFYKKTEALLALYNLSGELKSSINIGDNREIFLNKFLKGSLPRKLSIEKGEIWDKKGNKTEQLDSIIIRDDCPALDFEGKNVYLSEGVFAVIEIKSNLDSTQLKRSGKTLERVKNIETKGGAAITTEPYLNRPLRLVFSYKGAEWDTLHSVIDQNNWTDLFDMICILGKGVIIRKGELFKWDSDDDLYLLKSKTAPLAFLYYYLVSYGSSFVARSINITSYFEPLNSWKD